jgi:Delta14-sterol reductase
VWSFVVSVTSLLLATSSKPLYLTFLLGGDSSPTVLGLDVKYFSRMRIQIIGWLLVAQSYAAAQYLEHGTLSIGMLVYQALILVYAIDFFSFEIESVSSMAMMSHNFGWLTVVCTCGPPLRSVGQHTSLTRLLDSTCRRCWQWGSYVMVPFFYSLQAWLLLQSSDESISPPLLVATCLLFVLGYTLYRG